MLGIDRPSQRRNPASEKRAIGWRNPANRNVSLALGKIEKLVVQEEFDAQVRKSAVESLDQRRVHQPGAEALRAGDAHNPGGFFLGGYQLPLERQHGSL